MNAKVFKICYTIKFLFLFAKWLGLVDNSLPLDVIIYIIENAMPELLSFKQYILPKLYLVYFSVCEKYK